VTSAKPSPAFAWVRGILFDFGGTLDGDGLHWLERFFDLYRRLDLEFPWDQVRVAFDQAERRLWPDPKMRRAPLAVMVEGHVALQFGQLQVRDAAKERDLAQEFVRGIRATAARNAAILRRLAARGFRLGVISNGCGNTTVLCEELGFAPYLQTILDSTEVGLRKPDTKFFMQAAAALQLEARELLMIGDSIERDIQPARSLGMRTAWITTTAVETSEADVVLHSLGEVLDLLPALPASLSRIKAGIFAAGQGSRLRSEGLVKPLVKIGDRSLIMHVLEGFAAAGVSEVVIIINEGALAVQEQVNECQWPFRIEWIVKTTPTSMESFIRVVEALAADGNCGPFLLSTVDTILPPNALENFVVQARENRGDLTLAINVPAEDDNPLWVRCETDSARVCALGETAAASGLATAGVYLVRPTILGEAGPARDDRLISLRQFLLRLLERGYFLRAVPIANSIDVDRPADIIAAQELVRQKG
jgi:HAD superfamily hydrolase (TIGR01549 family)